MCRRVLVIIVCSLVLAVLILSTSAVLAEGTSVSIKVTVVSAIRVENGSAGSSNVPVTTQMAGGFITFVSP